MQLQARYYSGIFWGPLQLVCAAITKNSGYGIGSVVIICWYMIVYRRDSTSRQFTHRCTVRIMCLSDTVHTARFPFHCIFRSPSAFSIKDAIMLAWFWGWFWLIHGICTQWYWTAKLTFLIYIDANPVFQDIVCKWQLRPTVCLLAQPYIWKTPRLMLLLAALSVLSIRMVVQLVELSGKGSYEDRYWA